MPHLRMPWNTGTPAIREDRLSNRPRIASARPSTRHGLAVPTAVTCFPKKGRSMPKVVRDTLQTYSGPDAAAPFAGPLGDYVGRAISRSFGLQALGANLETLMPGAASSHRHWHDRTDELVVVLSGVLMLVEDEGETPMRAGDIAVFPAGARDGHCLRNRSDAPADFLVVGSRDPNDRCHYADVDLVLHPDGALTRRDGSSPSTG